MTAVPPEGQYQPFVPPVPPATPAAGLQPTPPPLFPDGSSGAAYRPSEGLTSRVRGNYTFAVLLVVIPIIVVPVVVVGFVLLMLVSLSAGR